MVGGWWASGSRVVRVAGGSVRRYVSCVAFSFCIITLFVSCIVSIVTTFGLRVVAFVIVSFVSVGGGLGFGFR